VLFRSVLTAQRVDADTVVADVSGGHREVGHAHHHRGTLAVLGDAETVVDRGVGAGRVHAGRFAKVGCRNAGDFFQCLWAVLWTGDELRPALVVFAALLNEVFVSKAFGDDNVGHCVDDGDVRARGQLQVVGGLDVRRADEVDPARVNDDELGALAESLLHAGGEDRVSVRWVGSDEQHDIGFVDRLEVLRAGRRSERLLQAVAGG